MDDAQANIAAQQESNTVSYVFPNTEGAKSGWIHGHSDCQAVDVSIGIPDSRSVGGADLEPDACSDWAPYVGPNICSESPDEKSHAGADERFDT